MPSHKGRLIGLVLLFLVLIWFSTRKGDDLSDGKLVRFPVAKKAVPLQNGIATKQEGQTPVASSMSSVKGANSPPVVKSIRLLPIPVSAGQAVRAEVITEDKDGDFVQLLYEWQVNGKPTSGNNLDTLAGDQVHSADQIIVFVTPSDPYSKGEVRVSPLITVLNRPPEIVSLPPISKDDKGKYTYQIVAKDPDSDPLNYILLKGPPGMEVNPTTGLVHWDVAPLAKSQLDVDLEVNDGKGGKATQQFTLGVVTAK